MDSPFPGRATEPALLLDERSRPDFREAFGVLARRSSDIATAVTRVRLSTLDLSPSELERMESFRVLIAEINALTLNAEARLIISDPGRASRVDMMCRLLEAGRLEVRSAPLGGWAPDFSVFSGATGPHAVLTGFHWFERPYPHRGPAFASIHFHDAARLALHRHDTLWDRAHDVGPAIWSILSKAARSAGSRAAHAG